MPRLDVSRRWFTVGSNLPLLLDAEKSVSRGLVKLNTRYVVNAPRRDSSPSPHFYYFMNYLDLSGQTKS